MVIRWDSKMYVDHSNNPEQNNWVANIDLLTEDTNKLVKARNSANPQVLSAHKQNNTSMGSTKWSDYPSVCTF